jgi:hypothetical protein
MRRTPDASNGCHVRCARREGMGFTVTHQGGTKDVEFEDYARLLRKKGLDQRKEGTRDAAWEVVPVNGEPSD